MAGVRDDAPWCPWNIEFIRRINGLDSVNDVFDTVFDADYLVLGLGDVYLGAPVATPLDPRHRLVTTKYNPARTWTPENAVGIGGAYMCIYGMEGPGGYQFVGRTTQVWSRLRHRSPVRARLALAAAVLRPHLLVPGQPRGAAGPAGRHGRRPGSRRRDRRRHLLPGRARGLPGPQQRVDRRVPRPAGGGLRGRTPGLGGCRRVRPRGAQLPPSPRPSRKWWFPTAERWWRLRSRPASGRSTSRPGTSVVAGPATGLARGHEDGNRPDRTHATGCAPGAADPPDPRWWPASHWWSSGRG